MRPTIVAPDRAAVDAVAATVGDAPQFLDVDVDQVPGRGVFVSHDVASCGAQRRPRGRVGP